MGKAARKRRRDRWFQARKKAQHVPLPATVTALLSDHSERLTVGRQASVWVQLYRNEHGFGPTWRDLGQVLHPECSTTCADHSDALLTEHTLKAHTYRLICLLIEDGWLHATTEERSLQAGANIDTNTITTSP